MKKEVVEIDGVQNGGGVSIDGDKKTDKNPGEKVKKPGEKERKAAKAKAKSEAKAKVRAAAAEAKAAEAAAARQAAEQQAMRLAALAVLEESSDNGNVRTNEVSPLFPCAHSTRGHPRVSWPGSGVGGIA